MPTTTRATLLAAGEPVEIATPDGAAVVRHAAPCFTLDELFRGRSAEAWRAAYAGAWDWGPDRGREVIRD